MNYVRGWEITHCPQYMSLPDSDDLQENLLVQSALWNALRFMLVSRGDSVELRLASNPVNRTISMAVLIASERGKSLHSSDAVLERLLPSEYGWSLLDMDQETVQHAAFPQIRNWRVARLSRRLEYFDLPSDFPWHFQGHAEPVDHPSPTMTGPATDAAGVVSEAAGSMATATEILQTRLPDPPTNGDVATCLMNRAFPAVGIPVRDQVKVRSVCLPLLGELVERSADRQRVCLDMLQNAPAVLSLTLHPIDTAGLRRDRTTATHFRRCMEPFGMATPAIGTAGALSNAGFSQFDRLRTVYDRYWLPPRYLCNMTIRVAASNDGSALHVAHSLAARLGGMRAFDIIHPGRSLDSLERLADPSIDVPTADQHPERTRLWHKRLRDRLKQEGVESDELFAGFLLRMPHLYTLDESEQLLRIPFASHRGLPGIPTRVVPPFYNSGVGFQPLFAEPPADRIRLGVTGDSRACLTARTPESEGEDADIEPSPEESRHWHTMPALDLTKHATIFGRTGSGKSVTTRFLLRELTRLDVPFLVIEPVGTEYYDQLAPHVPGLKRWCLEGGPDGRHSSDYLYFDPLRLQPGVTVARHVSYLKSCFLAAFPMTDVQALVFENGLFEYYTQPPATGGCGLSRFTRGSAQCHRVDTEKRLVWPSYQTFYQFFIDRYLPEAMRTSEDSAGGRRSDFVFEWKQMFQRRFSNLAKGPLGTAFERADAAVVANSGAWNPFGIIPAHPTVIELDGVPDNEQKALIMSLLLTFLYERRQADDIARREGQTPESPGLRHVLLVEEAHRLLSRSSAGSRGSSEVAGESAQARAVSMFVDMIAEIRKYGQGLVIVEQIPTKIASEAVKNSNLKIMLQLPSQDDRDYLGEAMNFNDEQKQFVTNLKTGEFVVFEEHLDQPVLLSLPHPDEWDRLSFV